MQECNEIEKINFFLTLMGYKEISEESLKNSLTKYVVIEDIGFIGYSVYYERSEIDYLYVIEEYRNKGYASKLLEHVINKGLHNITLEVSEDNISAINLYKKFGFEIVSKREKYYNGKDAYLMLRK